MHWILVIADDLTGAIEAGAQFAARGILSRVSTQTAMTAAPDVSVLVMDTETRHLPPAEAYAIVHEAAVGARRHSPWLIYKKTDSTLRGNIAAEFRALLDVFPERSLIYAPAYPAMGRTVRGGRLYVGGVPAHLSVFAADPLNPVRDSDIRVLLEGVPVQLMDAESDAEIMATGQAVVERGGSCLAAGPAALAGALAECIPFTRGIVRSFPLISRCLVVNGSIHPASIAQVAFAQDHGCFDSGWRLFHEDPGGSGLDRAMRIGECVCRSLEASPADALIVFGGDTVFGIQQALGAQPFDPYGEILPGVPLSRGGGLIWITKAGGFGDPRILCEIRRRLT